MTQVQLKIATPSTLKCVMDSSGVFTIGRGKEAVAYQPNELLDYCADLMDQAKLNGVSQIETYITVGNAIEQYKLLYPTNNQKFKASVDKSRFGMEYNSKSRTALMNIATNADNIRKAFVKDPSIAFQGLDSLAKKARGYTRPTATTKPKKTSKSKSKSNVAFKAQNKSENGLDAIVDMSLELVTLALSLGQTEAQVVALIQDNFKDLS